MKKKKIIKLLDPEPNACYPIRCGHEERYKTGSTIVDMILVPTFIDAPRHAPADYIKHSAGCLWAQWAMREFARRMK